MRLGDHFQQVKKKYHKTFFSGICFDHRKIKKNYIFFANIGEKTNGNIFIEEAKQNGATIIISSVETGKNIIKLPTNQ